MVIILEGVNKTGKSTLAGMIQDRFGLTILYDREHVFDSNRSSVKNYMKDKLYEQVRISKAMQKGIMLDRSFITESVYGQLDRGYKIDYFDSIQSDFKDLDALLIYCTDDTKRINERNEKDMTNYVALFNYYYNKCELDKVKINIGIPEEVDQIMNLIEERLNDKKLTCYFASPFFNEEQIEREEAMKLALRNKNITVFSPKEFCLLVPDSSQEDRDKVFTTNLKYLNDCDFVFAITDGKDIGTIWECGYAHGINKPIIYFCETLGNNPFNVMLAQSGKHVILSRNELSKLTKDDIHKILKEGKQFLGKIQ